MFLNADVLAVIFSYIDLQEKKSFRSVNTDTVKGFNNAVQLGYIRIGIGTLDSGFAEPWDEDLRWFPVRACRVPQGDYPGIMKCTISGGWFRLATATWSVVLRSGAKRLQWSRELESRAAAGFNKSALEVLRVSNLCRMQALEWTFLANFRYLREVSIVDLPALESIDDMAFFERTCLRMLQLRKLPKLKEIGYLFAS